MLTMLSFCHSFVNGPLVFVLYRMDMEWILFKAELNHLKHHLVPKMKLTLAIVPTMFRIGLLKFR